MLFRTNLICILALVVLTRMGGCHGASPNPPPCATAAGCVGMAQIEYSQDSNCFSSYPPPDERKVEWQAYNKNPSKDIYASFSDYATYENGFQPPPVPQMLPPLVRLLLHNGSSVEVGCQTVDLYASSTIVTHKYQLGQACFAGDSNCPPTTAELHINPAKPDECLACSTARCMHYDELAHPTGNPALDQAAKEASIEANNLIKATPPTTTSFSALLAAANTCKKRSGMRINADGTFVDSGPTCFGPAIDSPDATEYLGFTVPNQVEGVSRKVHPNQTNLTFPVEGTAIGLAWFDAADHYLGRESVTEIMVTPDRIAFVGDRKACVAVDLPQP